MTASVIKQVIFENSLNFERIFKYNKECKSLIAWVFIGWPIYYMTEKIAKPVRVNLQVHCSVS